SGLRLPSDPPRATENRPRPIVPAREAPVNDNQPRRLVPYGPGPPPSTYSPEPPRRRSNGRHRGQGARPAVQPVTATVQSRNRQKARSPRFTGGPGRGRTGAGRGRGASSAVRTANADRSGFASGAAYPTPRVAGPFPSIRLSASRRSPSS